MTHMPWKLVSSRDDTGNMEGGQKESKYCCTHHLSTAGVTCTRRRQSKFQQAWGRDPEATPLAEELLKIDDS